MESISALSLAEVFGVALLIGLDLLRFLLPRAFLAASGATETGAVFTLGVLGGGGLRIWRDLEGRLAGRLLRSCASAQGREQMRARNGARGQPG